MMSALIRVGSGRWAWSSCMRGGRAHRDTARMPEVTVARTSATGRPYRRAVAQLKATNRICWLCGKWIDASLPARHPMSYTADHIVPRSLGGRDTPDNLRPAHRSCNSSRGNRPHRRGLRTSRQW